MKTKYSEIRYAGSIFGLDFGLYGYEDIDFKESKDAIEHEFKVEYEEKLKQILEKIGLKYVRLDYYSPRFYNFETDSIDLVISKEIQTAKLEKYIKKYQDEINEKLSENKSYDGYFATTVSNVETELELMNKFNYEPDIIVLKTILHHKIDFTDFDMNDHVVYSDEDEDEE
jgi:hypothetical protein